MITVFGISGKKTVGKDTLAKLMIDNADVVGCRVGFADALKEEVAKAVGKTPQFIETNKSQFRGILQWWGTDFRRYYEGDRYWVDKVIVKIDEKIRQGCKLIIIPDVRFLSEAEALQDLGASLIRVARPIVSVDNHSSEMELDGYNFWNHIVLNSGSLMHLEDEARKILKHSNIPLKQLSQTTIT